MFAGGPQMLSLLLVLASWQRWLVPKAVGRFPPTAFQNGEGQQPARPLYHSGNAKPHDLYPRIAQRTWNLAEIHTSQVLSGPAEPSTPRIWQIRLGTFGT